MTACPYSSVAGVLFNKNQTTLIEYPCGKAGTSYTISNGVTCIGENAFTYTSLTNVTIPTSVTNIGNGAFDGAFNSCYSLTAITVDPLNSFYSSLAGVLFDKTQTTLLQFPAGIAGSYTIPSSVTNIAACAFYICAGLTNVTIPNGVTSIGDNAFEVCSGLTSVTIPDSVIGIGDWAFNGSGLTSVTIPNSVTTIGEGSFASCNGLTNVTIPNSVTNIEDSAFEVCSSLTSVNFQGNAPSLGEYVFYGDNNATVYYLPGTTGWGTTFGGRPTALWFLPNPVILEKDSNFGVQSNRFGFMVSWATNIPVVVEVITDLANPIWYPLDTNILTGGSVYFSDPQWTNYSTRLYRLRSP